MLSWKTIIRHLLHGSYTTGSSGSWRWKRYADGTFDAWCTRSGNYSFTSGSTNGLYFSGIDNNTMPAAIGAKTVTGVTYGVVTPTDYIIVPIPSWNVSGTSWNFRMRIGRVGASAAAQVQYTYRVTGTWT